MAIQVRKWRKASGEQCEAYVVRYTGKDGKRHIDTHAKKKDAEAAWARIKTELGEGTHVAPSQSLTVEQAAEEWLAHCEVRRLERATVHRYRVHVRLHIVPRIGKLKLTDLTKPALAAFEARMLREGCSGALCRKVRTSLCSIVGEAERTGKIKQNVVKGYRGVTGGCDRERLEVGVDIPTPAEMKAIVDAADDPKFHTLFLVTAATGMSASEMRGLRWPNVDLKTVPGKIRVVERIDEFRQVGAPKRKHRNRTIPIGKETVQALREWQLKTGNRDGLVFTAKNGRDITHQMMRRNLVKAGVAAGVVDKEGNAKYTGMHALRHFNASWCLNSKKDGGRGLSAHHVKERLGHSNISMTINTYGHLFPHGDDGGELDRAEEALFG